MWRFPGQRATLLAIAMERDSGQATPMKMISPIVTACVLGIVSAGCAGAQPGPGTAIRVYLGTYTSGKSKGIYTGTLDRQTGQLTGLTLAAETKNPSFLALHPKLPVLYVVGEVSGPAGKPGGAVSAFAMDKTTGQLTLLNQQSSGGAGPCYVSVDPTGRTVLVANYGGGSIASLPLGPDGKLREPATFIQHTGSSVNPRRQTGPHAHCIIPETGADRVWVCDLGLDKVFAYALNAAEGTLTPSPQQSISMKPGAGPRQLAIHPNGQWMYVVNELDCTVTRLARGAGGSMEPKESVSTLGQAVTNNSCAEIEVHPSGKYVYASNRGADTIAVFGVDSKTGTLKLVQEAPTAGKTPRHFGIDPTGRWVLAENQGSDSIVVFRVEESTGKLTAVGSPIEVGAPVCVLFVP
jgi:6-phosphogluconolactonase